MFWVPCFDVRYVGCMLFFVVLCCRFLWIVRFWLALWYLLAFICTRQMIKYRNKEATSLNLKLISRIPLIVCIIHYKVKKFWIDQLLCYKFWKSLNRFWTFWTLTENSEQILNILNIDWTESKHWRKRLSILNSVWTYSEHSEHCLKSMNRFRTFWKVWTESEHSEHCLKPLNILNIVWKLWTDSEHFEHCLKSLHILSRVWTFFLNKSCDISSINYFFLHQITANILFHISLNLSFSKNCLFTWQRFCLQ